MNDLTDAERAIYFEKQCLKATEERDRFKKQLCEAHALIGRLVHQLLA